MTNAGRDSTVFDVLESFDEKLNDNAKFLRSYMKQFENLLKFIRASREPNFLLHLSSLHTNVKYFFAHDLYKYDRLTPYYLADMADLKLKDPETWSALETGEIFSVFKSDIPFCGLAVDQGLEQEIRNLKIAGGVVGITQNESALGRYFLIEPELTRIIDSFWDEYGANTKVAKEHYQLKGDTAKRIYTRSKAMKEGIAKHIGNPFSATSNLKVLMNILTNTVLPPDSQVIKRDSIGCETYHDFVTLRILPVLGPMRGISLWGKMSKKKPVTLFQCNRTSSVSYEGQSNRTAGRERLVDPVSFNSAETT